MILGMIRLFLVLVYAQITTADVSGQTKENSFSRIVAPHHTTNQITPTLSDIQSSAAATPYTSLFTTTPPIPLPTDSQHAEPGNSSNSNESPLFVCSWGFVAFLVGIIATIGIWLTMRSQRIKSIHEVELNTPVHTSTYSLELVASPVNIHSNSLQSNNFESQLMQFMNASGPETPLQTKQTENNQERLSTLHSNVTLGDIHSSGERSRSD
ncbi:hypothetical protein HDV06_000878 [Boothiomyces sp. JEL0866]|nr:hypothetical protein HDV06_000878 [Boothiomyces sp. JEL0866]